MTNNIQLALLMWKNLTYRRRHRVQQIVELLLPLFLFYILVPARKAEERLVVDQCYFRNRALPSAGTMSWIEGVLCSEPYRCFQAEEIAELMTPLKNSLYSKILVDTRKLIIFLNDTDNQDSLSHLSHSLRRLNIRSRPKFAMKVKAYLKKNETFSQFIRTNTSLPHELVDELLGSRLDFQVFSHAGLSLKQIVCSPSILSEYLVVRDGGLAERLQKALCSLPEPILQALKRSFISEVDWTKFFTKRLTSGSAQVMNAVESLWSLLQRTESLAKEVSSMASLAEFLESLGVLSSQAFYSKEARPLQHPYNILCDFFEFEDRSHLYKYEDINFNSSFSRSDDITSDCLKITKNILHHPIYRILFAGKILYTPPTQATQKVMAEVNQMFQNLAKIHDLKEAWDDLSAKIFSFIENHSEMRAIQNLLSTPGVAQVLEQRLHGSFWNISTLRNFLSAKPEEKVYTWHKAYAQVVSLVGRLSQLFNCMTLEKIEAVASEEELVHRAAKLMEQRKFWAGIVFLLPDDQSRSQADLPPYVQFKIRMDIFDTTRTDKLKDWYWRLGPDANPDSQMHYVRSGFVYIQDLIEHAIMRIHMGTSTHQHRTGIYIQQMPYPCYVDDKKLPLVTNSLPLFLTLTWVYSVAMIIKAVVHEKETRLKETMKSMGLTNTTLWLGWFLSNLIPFCIITALILIILKITAIFHQSDPVVVFLFFTSFAVATISQCLLISTLFSQANLAAGCGGLIYLFCYLPYATCSARRDHIIFPIQLFVSLLSPVAFCFGCDYISSYEMQGVGVQWRNMFFSHVEFDYYSLGTSGVMLLFDAFLYGMATLYIEAVFPGQYGIPKPWNFPFKKSYWFGKSSTDASPHPIPTNSFHSPEVIMEEPPTHLNVAVSIRNLVKIYHGSDKVVINDLSLDFYEDQVTSFLGHSGAGKTTTMSVLMGFLAPTSGTAYVRGRDIRFDMDTIRKTLGICPQHNVLFDYLTTEEHIWFYGHLKGLSKMRLQEKIEQILLHVGLQQKRYAQTEKLSGGMQRKLSVAIAFIGDPEVVFLDEPTAGVDPYAQRGIWEFLLKYKAGRTIVLSTHYMEEADLLGDRVAIISQGQLCCCGSSLFLKTMLGTGYYLTLVKRDVHSTDQKAENIPENHYNIRFGSKDKSKDKSKDNSKEADQLMCLIQKFIPGAQLVEDIGQEVVYSLPYNRSKDGSFGKLFKELDNRLNELGISRYGISDSSLEEIFLKVTVDTSIESPEAEEVEEMDHWSGGGLQASHQLTGLALMFQQLRALLTKRFLYTIRNQMRLFVQIVVPAIFVFIALLFTLIIPPDSFPPLRLEPWMYGPQLTFISDESPSGDRSSARLLKALLDDPGFGTKCMKKEGDLKDPCPLYHETVFTDPNVPASVLEVFQRGNWTKAKPSPECNCSFEESWNMFPDCPEGAGGLPPPQMRTKTGDTLYHLTGRNITDYLVKTYPKTLRGRYGGFSLGVITSEPLPSPEEVETMVKGIRNRIAVSKGSSLDKLLANLPSFVNGLDTHQNMKLWFDNKGPHALPSYINIANNGLLRANLPSGADRSRYGITVINHPLFLNVNRSVGAEAAERLDPFHTSTMAFMVSLIISISVLIAMSFVPAILVLSLTEEQVNKSKHLQIISGMKPVVYWLSNFAWDMCNYLVSAGLVVLIFLCFQKKAYVSSDNLPALILLLVLYGWSVTPMMYPASFFFSVPSTAYVTLMFVNLFIGINTVVATYMLEYSENPELKRNSNMLKQYFLILPPYCLGSGMMDLAKNQHMADAYVMYDLYKFVPPLSRKIVGKHLLAMTVSGVIFFTFTVLMEYQFFIRLLFPPSKRGWFKVEDEDVANERKRITSRKLKEDILVLHSLTKIYWMSEKPAVDRLCLGIPRGECFGLLGVNGAGKTSTFQMLTGETLLTAGDASLKGYSIITNIRNFHKNIGYCPQCNPIHDLLTGRENLVFYCRLRGMPEDEIPGVVKLGLSTLGLMQYADKPTGQYSGGNKRKLCMAIALIGAPPVIFLDEPTTGIDPHAKWLLWNCIIRLIKDGKSVVLSSHSPEECEALCTRMAIMGKGRFLCLGTVQHLKNKFGDGYTITLRISGTNPDTGPLEKFMEDSFPDIILKEKYHTILQYQLPSHICSLAKVFDILSANWSNYNIRDYSISQTALDQVFLHFVKEQSHYYWSDNTEGPASLWKCILG